MPSSRHSHAEPRSSLRDAKRSRRPCTSRQASSQRSDERCTAALPASAYDIICSLPVARSFSSARSKNASASANFAITKAFIPRFSKHTPASASRPPRSNSTRASRMRSSARSYRPASSHAPPRFASSLARSAYASRGRRLRPRAARRSAAVTSPWSPNAETQAIVVRAAS